MRLRSDELESVYLNIKFPWYNSSNKIIGIFGISFLLCDAEGKNDSTYLSKSLMSLLNLNLMGNNKKENNSMNFQNILPGQYIGSVYLTKRYVEIVKYLLLGKTAKEIGKILNLSHKTIEFYLAIIKNKFKVKSRSELIEKVMTDLFL